jgi:hypothetical protein
MKKIFLLFSVPIITFIVILLLSFSKQNQIQEKLDKLNNLSQSITQSSTDLKIESLFANELNLVTADLVDLATRAKLQKKFWDEIISTDLNIVSNHTSLSSSSVNTEITKLLSFLNRSFENRKVKLGSNKINNLNIFAPESPKASRYGFGFVAYDGFWPSFDREESNNLLKQAKVIKEICEFLLDSYGDKESFNLLSIKRESAGAEDSKHIGENQYIANPEVKLLRDSGLIDSYIFEVVFTGKTQNIRSFINQLRPPYSLRSIKVERPSVVDTQTGMNFFEDSPNSGQTDILPIIRDITSTFTIIVEYIFAGPSDLITQIQDDLSEGFERNELEVVLQEFK